MAFNRRSFLHRTVSLAGLSVAGLPLATRSYAADTDGYRALVCVFLLGGMDNHDTLIPFDMASYSDYAAVRGDLLSQYTFINGGSTRELSRLLPLTTSGSFGGREFALPEELAGIKGLYDAGHVAIVGNVGPLIEPVTRDAFLNETARVPRRLFSHNDQQSTWYASAPEGAQFGWGGRFMDVLLDAGANALRPEFSALTTGGNELFITGSAAVPYQVGVRGAAQLQALQALEADLGSPAGDLRVQLLRDHVSATGVDLPELIGQDYAQASASALATNELYDQALANAEPLTTLFPGGNLGGQLQAVANTIAARASLGVNRQVFFVGLGGFDTHSNQVQQLPALQRELDAGIVAFFNAMQELDVADDVTLFTASDFGRTLAVNGDGTDHGWASHHLVVGEAVNGGNIYGDIPPSRLGHALDAGGGRLIPTLSVEQYAARLGGWFGLNGDELAAALPNLAQQGNTAPGFI
ncbi:MAG: DUF1501 domain-containing protein [Pseudomonadota bacterium]